MKISELNNKRILVVGLGVTGQSVVRFLTREKIAFDICDERADDSVLNDLPAHVKFYNSFSSDLFCQFDVIILSPGIPRAHPALVSAIKAGVDVIGDIELFADAVTQRLVAVTGSNGKSTVVAWLANVLNACGVSAVACGNIGEPALDSLAEDVDVLVLELSSYQLESTRSLRPMVATVLNVSEDHLDRYDSLDHYASVKRQVYVTAAKMIANRDDQQTWPQLNDGRSTEYFSCDPSTVGEVTWHASLLKNVSLSLPGAHNVANALVVLAMGNSLDVPMPKLIDALTGFKGLAHRSEFVGERNGVRWYNDSKGTNVDACVKAILSMPGPVVLIAGGISKSSDFSELCAAVESQVKLVILMGRDRQLMADQLNDCAQVQFVESVQQAVDLAADNAAPGDVVLLSPACSSFDMFKNFEERGQVFTSAVREVLAA